MKYEISRQGTRVGYGKYMLPIEKVKTTRSGFKVSELRWWKKQKIIGWVTINGQNFPHTWNRHGDSKLGKPYDLILS